MKEKILVRFQRGRKKVGGRGVGLYIVRKLVEDFDGHVREEDRVPGESSQGAKFIVDLPAAPQSEPPSSR